MPQQHDARPRARSAFVAAFLTLLFPGLGHAYAGAWPRALAFAAAPLLFVALVAGYLLRVDRLELAGLILQPWVLTSIFVLNLVALAYRLVAIVDAYRVTEYLNGMHPSGGRLGTPRVPLNPLSVAGLLAVILVMTGGHVAVARYDLLLARTADCIFDPNKECPTDRGSPSPDPSGPSPSGPGSPSPEPTPVGSLLPNETAPPWNGTDRLNILLIGADEQGGGHNTDTLIVVSIDPVTKRVAMFSLPRDTVDVPIPPGPARSVFGSVYRGKINSFFVNVRKRGDLFPGTDRTRGYNGLKAVLGELYDLDIQYFVEVNFDGFRKIVDSVGGVTINVQVPIVDDRFPAGEARLQRVYIPAGVQHMTGADALVYARSRNGTSDFDRAQRQQRVLLSLREHADIGTILPRIDAVAEAVGGAVRTDIPREIIPRLLGLADSVDTRNVRSYVLTPPLYQREVRSGDPRGYVLIPNLQKIRAAVKSAFELEPEFEERRAKLAEEAATVWVLNGSGTSGQAARIAAYLDHVGIAASAPNQKPEKSPAATRILVLNGAQTRLPETIALLESAFGVTAEPVADPTARVDVIVITAKSTPNLTPPPAP